MTNLNSLNMTNALVLGKSGAGKSYFLDACAAGEGIKNTIASTPNVYQTSIPKYNVRLMEVGGQVFDPRTGSFKGSLENMPLSKAGEFKLAPGAMDYLTKAAYTGYLTVAEVVAVAFDLSDWTEASVNDVKNRIYLVNNVFPESKIFGKPLVIIGTKSDLTDSRLTLEDLASFKNEGLNPVILANTSAMKYTNINETLDAISRLKSTGLEKALVI